MLIQQGRLSKQPGWYSELLYPRNVFPPLEKNQDLLLTSENKKLDQLDQNLSIHLTKEGFESLFN